jgi:hypothetical protein
LAYAIDGRVPDLEEFAQRLTAVVAEAFRLARS